MKNIYFMYVYDFIVHYIATLTTDTLCKLNIALDKLPPKCLTTLDTTAKNLSEFNLINLDRTTITLLHSRELSDKLREDYEILKLKQKNQELQMRIDQNNKFLEGLRSELECSRKSLANGNPNPDNIHDYIRQIKQKLVTYEECYEKAKNKYTSLGLAKSIMPRSLMSSAALLATLREEAAALKVRADDVILIRDARDKLRMIR